MSVNPTELLKNAYGGTFEENVKTYIDEIIIQEWFLTAFHLENTYKMWDSKGILRSVSKERI